MKCHIGFPIDQSSEPQYYLVYSGPWKKHCLKDPDYNFLKSERDYHELVEYSGADKLTEILPNIYRKFLFVPMVNQNDRDKLRNAWSIGSSDFAASALAWAAPENLFNYKDTKAPIILFSCDLDNIDPTKGLKDAKLAKVTNTEDAALSLNNKWKAVIEAHKLNRGVAFVLRDDDALILINHLLSEDNKTFPQKLLLKKDGLTFNIGNIQDLKTLGPNQPPFLIPVGPDALFSIAELLGINKERFDPSPFTIGEVLWVRKIASTPTTNPSELLRANNNIVDFAERKEEAYLDSWWQDDEAPPVFLLTGPGGAGKTRLVDYWLKKQQDDGVIAGWLNPFTKTNRLDILFKSETKRVLIVIDYAENMGVILKELLILIVAATKKKESNPETQVPRLILLARNAGEWWDWVKGDSKLNNLKTGGDIIRSLDDLLPDDQSQIRLFNSAIKAFAKVLDLPAEKATKFTPDAKIFSKPLPVLMAAYSALFGGDISNEEELYNDILKHELKYIRDRFPLEDDNDKDHFRRVISKILTYFTLTRGADNINQAIKRIQRSSPYFEYNYAKAENLAVYLSTIYGAPDYGRYLRGLEPDVLGEHLVANTLREYPKLLDEVFSDNDPQAWRDALTVLSRLSNKRPGESKWLSASLHGRLGQLATPAMEVAIQTGWPLGEALATVAEKEAGIDLADKILAHCPDSSLTLTQLAISMNQKVISRFQHSEDNESNIIYKATHYDNLASWLQQRGSFEEALDSSLEAIELFRYAFISYSKEYLSSLATSLNTSGLIKCLLGRKEEGIHDYQEAIELLPKTPSNESDINQLLTFCYDNLANAQYDLKRYNEAVDISWQLLAYLEKHEAIKDLNNRIEIDINEYFKTDDFNKNKELVFKYATFLNNMANRLDAVGQMDDALVFANKATFILSKMKSVNADYYLPDYLISLTTKSRLLENIGDFDSSILLQKEQIQERKMLAFRFPDKYEIALAGNLDNLSLAYEKRGDFYNAISFTQEAIVLYKKHLRRRFLAVAPELAKALRNLGGNLYHIGRNDEAFARIQESIELFKTLSRTEPDVYLTDLANSLQSIGLKQYQLGQKDIGISHVKQAVDIYSSLREPVIEPLMKQLIIAYNNYTKMLFDVKQYQDAERAICKTENILRKLTVQNPLLYNMELVELLNNYGFILWEMGKIDEALTKAKEAVVVGRKMVDINGNRESFKLLAVTLSNCGQMLIKSGYQEKGRYLLAEALYFKTRL